MNLTLFWEGHLSPTILALEEFPVNTLCRVSYKMT